VNELDTRLAELGDRLDVPAAPTLASVVGARLRSERAADAPSGWTRQRRLLVGSVAALLVAGGALAAPAVGDLLGIRGARVNQAAPPVTTTAPLPGTTFDLGRRATLAEAARAAGFDPAVPTALAKPAAIWVDTATDVPIVSFVYADGTLVSEFRAEVAAAPILQKFSRPDTRIEELHHGSQRGIWVEGAHEVAIRAGGQILVDRLRTSDSALLVEHRDLTVRIETAKGRDEAIRIANSLP
jgi:hypothetical protein